MNEIREVYLSNFEEEMEFLSSVTPSVDLVCISCEFGGVVSRPLGQFRSQQDYHFQTMRSNVELIPPLQIAITLADAEGKLNLTWQFNMLFSTLEMFQQEILESLVKTGANLPRMGEDGVPPLVLGAALLDSGLLGKTWVSQHAGYDFGYLISSLFGGEVGATIDSFKEKMTELGGSFVDLKWANGGNGPVNAALGVQAGNQSQAALLSYLQSPPAPDSNCIYGFD